MALCIHTGVIIIAALVYFYPINSTDEKQDLFYQDHKYFTKRWASQETIPRVDANDSSLPLCPVIPPNLTGSFNLLIEEGVGKTLEEVEERVGKGVKTGGKWAPRHCKARDRVAILVPFRDRAEHLNVFLTNMHPFLQKQLIDYWIFVVEQAGTDNFNRAALFNVGFIEANAVSEFDCYVFHDVDLLPENDTNFYTCPDQPRHMAVAIDIYDYKLQILHEGHDRWRNDGLNSLLYKRIEYKPKKLFTWILVEIPRGQINP